MRLGFEHMAVGVVNSLHRVAKAFGSPSHISGGIEIFRGPDISNDMGMDADTEEAVGGRFDPIAEIPSIQRLTLEIEEDMAFLRIGGSKNGRHRVNHSPPSARPEARQGPLEAR